MTNNLMLMRCKVRSEYIGRRENFIEATPI